MVYVLYRHAKNLRHVSPQNRFTLKEFETTTREIGLIIFPLQSFGTALCKPKYGSMRSQAPDSCCIPRVPLRIARAPLVNEIKEGCSYPHEKINRCLTDIS